MRRWHIGEAPTALQLNEIASVLKGGAVVLLPTDTIYGLHALATTDEAVERIVELKGREETKPFIVLASTIEQLLDLGIDTSSKWMEALTSIWPAPLTAILPLSRPIAASRGLSALAVRIPAVDWLRLLLERTGPLVSTSANRSGEPPVEQPSALSPSLQDHLDIVDGGVRNGEPSAILDLTGREPRFIREGDPVFTQKLWKTLRNSL
ncbi:MAG: L-threonylcarbamoyladenylate synthase [Acidobacteriota bacterium]